jgi:AcrR family transcriptional regulator
MLAGMSEERPRHTTVDWSAPRRAAAEAAAEAHGTRAGESLRARKKRLTRQQLSDTATAMFLERGFDAVRVSEIARACGVSETTAFNYFPTKESLLLDRWESTSGALREALADTSESPVRAAERLLDQELSALIGWLDAQEDFAQAVAGYRRFGELLHSTPSLRAHQHATTERLTAEAAEALAVRHGTSPAEPEPLIAAIALIGLWQVQARSITTHLETVRTPAQLAEAVAADVRRAVRVLEDGVGRDL